MHIERLYAERFRNLGDGEGGGLAWWPHRHFNVLVGDNGAGKTNVLEAVAVLAGLRSFRTPRLPECVVFGATRAVLGARVVRHGVAVDLGVEVGAGARRLFLDGKPAASAAQFLGRLVAVPFTPDDLRLPTDAPEARRRWLDRAAFHHEPAHLDAVRAFDRALLSRNALLKAAPRTGVDGAALDAFDAVLARTGAQVAVRRAAVLDRLRPLLQDVFGRIAASDLRIDVHLTVRGCDPAAYADVASATTSLASALRQRRDRDAQVGSTTRGPHRDDVQWTLQGRSAALHASQGQCRALVLALKIAEIRSLEAALGEAPVLLLDDVSSELDAARNRALMTYLDELGGQVIVSTPQAASLAILAPRQVFHIAAGQVSPGAVWQRPAPAAPVQPPLGVTDK